MPHPLPTISIVTPSYNQGRFIDRTIQSVLNQSHAPAEYRVMDGGSTDDTVAILKKYGHRLQWTSEKDKGQADAIDRGFRQCTSDILAWLNSDDRFANENVLQKVAEAFAADQSVDIVYGDGELIDPNGNPFRQSRAAHVKQAKDLLILPAGFALQPAIFFRRQLYLDSGGIDPRFFAAFDYDLWLRMFAEARRVTYLPEVLARATCHPDAKSVKGMWRLIGELVEIKRKNERPFALTWPERIRMRLNVLGLYAYYAAVRTGLRRAVEMGQRLGINLVFLNPDRAGGAETYARSLLREYQQMDLDGRITLFVGRGHGLNVDPDRFELVQCDIDPRHQYRRIIWEQTHLPKILDRHHLDLVHFPYSAYPIRYGGKCVVSIHDTTRFVAARGVPRAQIWYRRIMERRLHDRGHHVIAVSRADATLLQQHLGLPDQQISVVHHGVSDHFRVDRPFDGPRQYLLWVGRPYEHKRLDTLIEAHAMMKSPAPPLRLIGISDGRHLKAGANISIEKGVNHDELPAIYQRALALVFSSSYESFGLPALEAMACGTAVVCSDIPAFRELFAGAAEFTKVSDPGALAQGIDKVVADQAIRHGMELKGIELARQFTWRRCAQETMQVFMRA